MADSAKQSEEVAGPTSEETELCRRQLVRATAKITRQMQFLIAPDQLVELWALNVWADRQSGTWSGLYRGDELADMVRMALNLLGECSGVYYTINPLRPERFVKANPRVQRASGGSLAHDKDVLERRWLLIDIDPVKPQKHANDSATDEEKAKTLELAMRVRDYLSHADQGGLRPVALCDSGNGHHLLYQLAEPIPVAKEKLPLPDDDPIRLVLAHLDAKFSGDDGTIDTKVFNPGRIVKFPGTRACKGEASEERPHRRARVLEILALEEESR